MIQIAQELFAGTKPLDHDAQAVLNKTYVKSLRLEERRKQLSQSTIDRLDKEFAEGKLVSPLINMNDIDTAG